jgi:hypothetical protein
MPLHVYLQILFDKLLRTSRTLVRIETTMHKQMVSQLQSLAVGLFTNVTNKVDTFVDATPMFIQSSCIPKCTIALITFH